MDFASFKASFPGRFQPFAHQWTGTQEIINNPYFMLSDDMGLGKTKQAIDAAQFLYLTGQIDKVVVLASNLNIEVWHNERSGELKLHAWNLIKNAFFRVHNVSTGWGNFDCTNPYNVNELHKGADLKWYLTNYEYLGIRKDKDDNPYYSKGLARFLKIATPRTMLILDESFYVKNPSTNRTKGILEFRNNCGRVLLMNGTPVANSETELYSQLKIMHPSITGCSSFQAYTKKYGAISNGYKYIDWAYRSDLINDMSPYTVRRLKEDCLDLPKKPAVREIEVPLHEKTWNRYKRLQNEFLLEMETGQLADGSDGQITAYHILSQMTKLSQIGSGFVIENKKHLERSNNPDMPFVEKVKNILWNFKSYEKVNKALEIIRDVFNDDGPKAKVVVWTRFKFELKAVVHFLRKAGIKTYAMNSDTPQSERKAFLEAFNPKSVSDEQAVGVVSITLGRTGLNLAGAHVAIYVSNSFSNFDRKQSEDRIYRNGQTRVCKFYNLHAVGIEKNGNKYDTMDQYVWEILEGKRNVSEDTSKEIIEKMRQRAF